MKSNKIIFLLLICFAVHTLLANPANPSRPAMIFVSGGTFFMGSNENRSTERVHEVTIRTFFLSETPVTQDLYTAVMNENPSFFKGGELPVDSVTWFDAVRFCNALSIRFGFIPAYTINGENVTWNRESRGYRLPTEAEWEFAARGGPLGPKGPQDRVYFAGGDESANPLEYCWFSQNVRPSTGVRTGTQPVRGKLPNQLDLYDMSGNVWEWCWDWHDVYPIDPVSDYSGPATGKQRIYRGGSYLNSLPQLRSSFRIWSPPVYKAQSLGFRIAQNG
ncbi:MAG: formylglycine-generating enzyme family protein [Treponema sp.]|jgi:formylglycine-generating enzyme required for sulfatase activity|nr:formylglycine-generating enzyme family protein [Treponema sp.]